MSNIKTIDGRECWDIAAEEIVAEAPIDGAPARWHFRPYGPGSAKTLLKAVANKYKILPGGVTEYITGDLSAYGAFFDAHFIRMSNVVGENGQELSLEDQRAWLEQNPQVKADVINTLFKPEEIVADEAKKTGAAVLRIRSGAESSHRVKCWSEGQTLELTIKHILLPPSAEDRTKYDRSISKNRRDFRHSTMQVIVDYDLLESIYDRLARAVDGACLGEKPCTEANRIEWLKRIPFWWKAYAVDDVFGQDRIKNE